jgi:hypothetical protein
LESAKNTDYSCRVEGDSVQKFHDDVRKEGRIDLNFKQHYIETMVKTWLLEGRENCSISL